MSGMNVNGVVQGNELRMVAQEIFAKAKTQGQSLEAQPQQAASKVNPFQAAIPQKTEFTPEETKVAKASFEQQGVQIDDSTKQSVNSLAAVNAYSNLAFNSQAQLAGDTMNDTALMSGAGDIFGMDSDPEQGKKNPLVALLLNLLLDKDNSGEVQADPLVTVFQSAMASKKQK